MSRGANTRKEPAITDFDDFDGPNPHAFLSNFYVGSPIQGPGLGSAVSYPTGEHFFQAFKTFEHASFNAIVGAASPGQAKAMGRSVRLRADWEAVKYDVMALVLRCKFTLERAEGQLLLDTGDALLIEGTAWRDRVWGVDLTTGTYPLASPGRNWLGTLLMARRAELRAQRDHLLDAYHPTAVHNASFVLKTDRVGW